MYARPSGIVTLTTDFGLRDPYVGIMKGALIAASDKPRVVDLSHDVAAQDISMGAFMLWTAVDRFPPGTVHIGVVDPGVGTERRLLAATAHGQYWLVPDNGLCGAVLASADTSEVRVIDLEHLRLRRTAETFDGRDVLAPVAAWLASGHYGFSAMGQRIEDGNRTDHVFAGDRRVVHVDTYGNLITNVRGSELSDAATQQVICGGQSVPVHRTYGDVAKGDLLAYVGSFGLVEVAVANGNARDRLGMQRGASIELSKP
ncbi:MAG: S-adenosylmethionine hydrolase [Planctomycetota bacterium]|jgi:S-adenosylmethionine hydrolase